jgi:hypothetical protein
MMRLFGAIALAVAVAVLMAIWLKVNQTSTLPPNQPAPSLTPEASATKSVVSPYGIVHPTTNTGANQVCEIDHLVAIELGGDDTMANLWPECSPGYSDWQGFGFTDKDNFENWLWNQVCVQRTMTLEVAQTEIARNWVKLWDAAGRPCVTID